MKNFQFCISTLFIGFRFIVTQRLSVTPDGCPFPHDLGKFDYRYKKVQICDSLLPDAIIGLQPQTSPKPFVLTLEPVPDSLNDYYDVSITIPDEFVEDTVIAGTAIRIQKTDQNGEPAGPAGHFDPPETGNWKTFCCGGGSSKFHTLVYTFIMDVNKRLYEVKMRWYPLNFKEGHVVVQATVFANETTYWRIRTPQYKIPFSGSVGPPATTSEP